MCATLACVEPEAGLLPAGANGAGANGGSVSAEEARARLLLLGHHLLDFWANICLCHSLIVEEAEDGGPPIYQAGPFAPCLPCHDTCAPWAAMRAPSCRLRTHARWWGVFTVQVLHCV